MRITKFELKRFRNNVLVWYNLKNVEDFSNKILCNKY